MVRMRERERLSSSPLSLPPSPPQPTSREASLLWSVPQQQQLAKVAVAGAQVDDVSSYNHHQLATEKRVSVVKLCAK